MNRYWIIDWKTLTLYDTNELENITENRFDEFGSSEIFMNKAWLLDKLDELIEDEREILKEKGEIDE